MDLTSDNTSLREKRNFIQGPSLDTYSSSSLLIPIILIVGLKDKIVLTILLKKYFLKKFCFF